MLHTGTMFAVIVYFWKPLEAQVLLQLRRRPFKAMLRPPSSFVATVITARRRPTPSRKLIEKTMFKGAAESRD